MSTVESQHAARTGATGAAAGPWTDWVETRARVRRTRDGERHDHPRPRGDIDLASNDYLGLSRDASVARAAARAAHRYGTGAGASRVVTGTHALLPALERDLARYAGRREALVFSSGYAANQGLLGALGGPGTLLVSDAHAHASLIDGARLAKAEVRVVGHGDLGAVEEALFAHRTTAGTGARAAVVMESLYSVLGDTAPLAEAAALCARYGALLIVDEAHTLAAVPGGSAVRAAGLADTGHVIVTATLSKALGAQGGAILLGGDDAARWRSHLLNTARTFIFDTALAPPTAGAARRALALADDRRIGRLVRNAALAHRVLAAHPVTANRVERGEGAVHSVRMGSPAAAVRTAEALRRNGIAVGCFRPPSVPDGIARLRITVHADLAPRRLVRALETVAAAIGREDP
ncbi:MULTISPECIES: aminotransferase class I/II-fold pyridoxal phosphate-dependent enzyme [Micrococcaceae]|uniref:aminotransferase class I/II-fold pyridoxal phosphate-dependent enzyme n=1 Tax=Micrococcaceae TaxID=1268 RepID=UPI00160900D5|nr:aminotransferase class I/II-fold pyridoxal phosphate-dependent enzyme [Citricoccus sp.]MBB5750424.1 8-amino-7-oxononanoate synthase [Micrococcus sp. TA1]HRO29723.1 aminotransferase class I/II-fold pyridoxal phosphate-dependent enzyme [Citricoccus sp.]HRO93784.1 aminotransferase class I/II-fold pyridoxal phosphate-dependent enzyme [Citricoccus sp.]